jgi:hypothetical protein
MNEKIKSGVYYDLPFSDYLNHHGYGNSDLREFRHGLPAMMRWKREHRDEQGDTEATRIGKAAHCAILTPDLFDAQIAVKPDGMTFQSKENKALKAQWEAEGRTIISHADHQQIIAIREAFFGKPAAADAFNDAEGKEVTVYWTCPVTGVIRKCRPDWFTAEWTYDLKVSVEATKDLRTLTYMAQKNGWLNQGAGCRAGLNANGYDIHGARLVVVAPKPPQGLRVWLLELSAEDCDHLELENQNTCEGIALAESRNFWPSTPEQFVRIELPMSATWEEREYETDDETDGEEFQL